MVRFKSIILLFIFYLSHLFFVPFLLYSWFLLINQIFLVSYFFSAVGLWALITETTRSAQEPPPPAPYSGKYLQAEVQAARSGRHMCLPSDHNLVLPVGQQVICILNNLRALWWTHLSKFSHKCLEAIIRECGACFGSRYTKIGMTQRRLAWPQRKDDMQICEAFHM